MPRRGVEASIRSIAYTNAFATRPALSLLPARVLPNALLLVPFFFSRPTGSLTPTVHTPSSAGGVYATVVSRRRRPAIDPRRLSFSSASVRVEMREGSEPSARSALADMRPSALRVRPSDGAAGPRDREPSLEAPEGRAGAMYERIAEYIEDVQTSLRIDVSDHVYRRCMDELRSLREGRFDRVTQSLENIRALVEQLQSRLALVEDSRLDSPVDYREGRPEGPAPSRRPDAQPFPSAEQMNALAHMTAELNSTRRRTREVEQTSTARSPGAPTGGPGASVPPNASDAQGLRPTVTVTSRHADGIRPPMDANVASETQALPYAAGGMQEARRVPYTDDQDRGGAACGSREPIISFDPRWGGYQPVDLTAHPGPVDIRTLPVTPFGTLGPAAPGVEPVHTMLQEFSDVANYRMYRSENTSRLVTSGDVGRIAKYVQRCRGIRTTMRSFDGTDTIQLLPFLKDIRITLNAQHLTEGVSVRLFAHFLERDAKRLYTSYTMRGIRAGQLHGDISWPGLVNQFIKRYLTDEVLGEACDAVATA